MTRSDRMIRGMNDRVWTRALSYSKLIGRNISEYLEDLITDDLDMKKYPEVKNYGSLYDKSSKEKSKSAK